MTHREAVKRAIKILSPVALSMRDRKPKGLGTFAAHVAEGKITRALTELRTLDEMLDSEATTETQQ